MCGIIGYKGDDKANSVVLQGLKSLEYRGYDSWGIANINNQEINHSKQVGKIGHIKLENLNLKQTNIAIGHTRWATHGNVTQTNAHPHFSEDQKIAVVHNGIVENFQEIKDSLDQKGYKFLSQTDTEVIPQLIHFYHYKRKLSFKEAVRQAALKLDGYYAFVAIKHDSDQIIGARNGSPLVLGIGKNEYFAASDVPAFINHTKKVIYLNDNEMFIINHNIEIFNIESNKPVEHSIIKIDWDAEQAQKGIFKHFMLKEISEQKYTIRKAIEQPPHLIKKVTNMIKNSIGVFFVACGTSYHAGLAGSYLFSTIAKEHANVVLASEFPNYHDFLTKDTLMIAISQSGETADLLEAVRVAKQKGVKIISIVNVMGSTLMRLSDESVLMNAGPEICVLSTKSYTSQVAILTLLAYSLAGRYEQGRKYIEEASHYVDEIIDNNIEDIQKLANQLKDSKDIFIIGRDLAYPTALESALKIKEVSYIHAEGFAGGELKHGTIALIEDKVPVIVLNTEKTKKEITSNAMEVKSRGAYLIGINDEPNDIYDHYIYVPSVGITDPILDIIPIQILSYYLALARDCDPDKPRNLAKSVTVK